MPEEYLFSLSIKGSDLETISINMHFYYIAFHPFFCLVVLRFVCWCCFVLEKNIYLHYFNYSIKFFSLHLKYRVEGVKHCKKITWPIISNKTYSIKATATPNYIFILNWIDGGIVNIPGQITMGLKHCTQRVKTMFSSPISIPHIGWLLLSKNNTVLGPILWNVSLLTVLNSNWTHLRRDYAVTTPILSSIYFHPAK